MYVCTQTGTLTSEGLDFCVVIPVINGHLDSPLHDPTQLLPRDPIVVAMATCHSLTLIGGELSGDPLDVSMFQAINWVSFITYSELPSTQCSVGRVVLFSVMSVCL